MTDIIIFGSATIDLFLRCSELETKPIKHKTGTQHFLRLNEKNSVQELQTHTGGSATNTAATFSNLGFKAKPICAVGNDEHGKIIKRALLKRKIKISGVQSISNANTNYSVILSTGKQNRAIFVYRDASKKISHRNINWRNLSARLFHIGPLSGNFQTLTKAIFTAKQKKAIIALNPGHNEIQKGVYGLKDYLNETDYLFLNKKEAETLTGGSIFSEKKIFEKIKAYTKGIILITNGIKGVKIFDGEKIISRNAINSNHVDATGAGDAFSSGFSGMMLKTNGNMNKSLDFALKNSSNVVTQIGAKKGLLKT